MSTGLTNSNSESELIKEICKGNKTAFKELFVFYHKKLVQFCYYRTRDLDLSKDLVQEVFYKLWIGRERLDSSKSIKAYLYKSLVNQIINWSKHSSTNTSKVDSTPSKRIIANQIDPETQIDLESAIENLPEKLRDVFLLSRIQGFKYDEIAQICNISSKAVEKRMSKALSILRKIFSK